MKQNEQEWVKNITSTGMKVKVKDYLITADQPGSKFRACVTGLYRYYSVFLMIVVWCTGMAGCEINQKEDAVVNERLTSIYVDLLDARKAQPSVGVDSAMTADSLLRKHGLGVDSVLMKHGMNRQEFLDAVHAQSSNAKSWNTFYETVVRKLNDRQRKTDSLQAMPGARPAPSSQ